MAKKKAPRTKKVERRSAGYEGAHRISGRVVDRLTGTGVGGVAVQAWAPDDQPPLALASATSGGDGEFSLSIARRSKEATAQVALVAFDADQSKLLVRKPTLVQVGGRPANVVIEIGEDAAAEPTPATIDGLRKTLGLKIPAALKKYLERRGITTFAELRRHGGLAADPDAPVDAADPVVRALDAHAALSLLPTQPRVNAALIRAGFHDVIDVARAPAAAIAAALDEAEYVGEDEGEGESDSSLAADVHAVAQDQERMLLNLLVDLRIDAAYGERTALASSLQDALPKTCGCSSCQSAIGEVAYLVELLDYTLRHLRNNGQPVTLSFLERRLRQPLRDLPVTCADQKRRVRRIRIAIEILRAHLGPGAPTVYPAVLEGAYKALLEGIGTTFDELRETERRGSADVQNAFKARLQLPEAWPLSALFRDPTAAPGDPLALTEGWLNEMFGLRSTTLAPLAEAPRPDATAPQNMPTLLLRQRRFLWDRWLSEDYDQTSPTYDGRPFIDPDVMGLPDLRDVTPNPVARVARPDRRQWSVLDFFEERQYWINTTLTELRDAVRGPAADLRARMTTLLQQLQSPATSFPGIARTGMAGLTFAEIEAMYRRYRQGDDISGALRARELSADELNALGRVVDLVVAEDPILSSEWDDFYSAILGRVKRYGFYPEWKREEQQAQVTIDLEAPPDPLAGVTLSPYHFQLRSDSALGAATTWRPRPWRSTEADRRQWEDALRSRIEQSQNLVTVLQDAIDAAEVIALPSLRDLLLMAALPPGVLPSANIRILTDRYQIDFQEGPCAFTTRIKQAIQSLQGLLFGARNGLLDDPALSLDDDRFDEVWLWLGSFASWKAAALAFFFPENVARPTLRPRPSQGFTNFITALRGIGKLTPATAREAVAVYEQYFVDVCTLGDGMCVTAPAPGPAGSELFNYLFARSASGRLYWCYFDLDEEQSYWRRLVVPDLNDVESNLQLFGAAYYARRADECLLYVFATEEGPKGDRIVFARTNLRQNADWGALKWQRGVLEDLPANATDIAYARVLTDRRPGDPIRLCIWLTDREAYTRALNGAGNAWDPAPGFANVPTTGGWRRLGTGAARNGMDFACSTQTIPPRFVLAGDFDQDGQDEIAVIPNLPGTEGNDIWMMKFDPATQTWRHLSPIPAHPFDADIDIGAIDPPAKYAVAGDFDGDGFPEIAIAADFSQAGASSNVDDTGFWVRKFDPATATWMPLGVPTSNPYGVEFVTARDLFSNLFYRVIGRYAVVGDFDNDQRDEIAIAVTPIVYVGIPAKASGCTFFVFDLEPRSAGAHVWNQLPDLQCEPPAVLDLINPRIRASRFAVAGKFRPNDDRDILLVSKKLVAPGPGPEVDPNYGNDFWACRFDGSAWVTLQPELDCANVGVAARFGVAGDFDGDGADEVAIAQDQLLPDANRFAFWVEKLDLTGAWQPMASIEYGDRRAVFAVAGDFDADGRDELAVVTPDVWTTNIQVFDLNNGQWRPLQASNANLLVSGGALAAGPQPGHMPGEEFVVSGVAASLVPAAAGRARQLVMLAAPDTDNTARAFAYDTTITGSWAAACAEVEVKPALAVSSPVFATPDIDAARAYNARVPAALGSLGRRTNREYLDEMFYFVPMEIAMRLRENGAYREALDWCRLVYDYGAPAGQRIVSAKVQQDPSSLAAVYGRWLEDTLNPHVLAETRSGVYFKFTILLICRCLVDWADAEYSRADDQSIHNAVELYERALDLLALPQIRERSDTCEELTRWLKRRIGEGERLDAFEPVFRQINRILDPSVLAILTDAVADIAGSGDALEDQVTLSLAAAEAAAGDGLAPQARTVNELREESLSKLKSLSVLIAADPNRSKALTVLEDGSSNGNGRSRVLRMRRPPDDRSDQQVDLNIGRYVPAPAVPLCIPPNPAVDALRQHIELCLRKIRDCRDIAGLELCLRTDGQASEAEEIERAAPSPLAYGLQPLPYRYATLIERTKQLVELARQMESSMLQFIGSAEQERYQELKARQDLELTQAGLRLKDLQVVQAIANLVSAGMQRDRAQVQIAHFSDLLANGWSVNEELQVGNLISATAHQHATAITAWIEAAYGITSYSSAISSSGAAWAQNSEFHGLLATLERRAEEWQFQRAIAEQDLNAGRQQVVLAQGQLDISNQERTISAMQIAHAEQVVDFIARKFLSADLYEWMADVLQQVYRFFLQQATQLARLAELQLAFERQEPQASLIKADYWERPSTDMTPDVGASSTGTNSVRGLTGSARLLRDVYELDQYAFTKDQRKHQLSETFSLAQLDPFAFQAFRQTGRLPFSTPMSLFDVRLPGHYLRLIKRVRTSVIALIPPTMGIRASLWSGGPTRVTIGPDVFRTVTIQRGPQLVALTSPINSAGLFDLDAQPELLVPFEGIGVDGHWVFDMPKASNPFDYDAIADVLLTFDYTSLYSADYHEQVLKTMDRRVGADRAFGFRNEFADAWYDLNNPEIVDAPGVPMTVRFRTRRADFPPNITRIMIRQVLVQFVQRAGTARVVDVDALYYTTAVNQEVPANVAERAAASDATGLISTRRGAWRGLVGGAIDGDLTWTLTFPEAIKQRFKNEEITDILLVLSYEGMLP